MRGVLYTTTPPYPSPSGAYPPDVRSGMLSKPYYFFITLNFKTLTIMSREQFNRLVDSYSPEELDANPSIYDMLDLMYDEIPLEERYCW